LEQLRTPPKPYEAAVEFCRTVVAEEHEDYATGLLNSPDSTGCRPPFRRRATPAVGLKVFRRPDSDEANSATQLRASVGSTEASGE
jgi:hypothetical protein